MPDAVRRFGGLPVFFEEVMDLPFPLDNHDVGARVSPPELGQMVAQAQAQNDEDPRAVEGERVDHPYRFALGIVETMETPRRSVGSSHIHRGGTGFRFFDEDFGCTSQNRK